MFSCISAPGAEFKDKLCKFPHVHFILFIYLHDLKPIWSLTRINCYSDITEHLPHMKTLVHR